MAFGKRRRTKKCKLHTHIDYKDTGALRRFLSAQGKIHSRKRNHTCAKCQRRVQKAVKLARFMGILSYTA